MDGKGVSTADVMTTGANGVERKITDGVVEGEYYPNHEAIDFYHRYVEDIKLFHEIKSAILSKHLLEFSYFSSSEEETDRQVKPVRLLFKGLDWYLYAFCLLRNDFRYFKLSRMKNPETLPITFDDDFENVIPEKERKYENTVRIKVRLDRKAAFRVFDEVSGEIEEDEHGNMYVEIELPNDYNLYSYLFSFGDSVEILEPTEIRRQMKEIINNIAQKYKI